MGSKEFVNKCILVSTMNKDQLIKNVLSSRFTDMSDPKIGKSSDIPTGLDLLTFVPSPSIYPEYAFLVCSMQETREDMVRHILEYESKNFVSGSCDKCKDDTVVPEKKRRRGGMTRRSEDRATPNICVPSILSLFTKDENVMTNMPDILETYFPTTVCIYAGIYGNVDRSIFVLLAVDNGRYRTSWKSCGAQNKLTWFTSNEDVDKSVMTSIVNNTSTVHVVRKRNGEIRYMGKCTRIDDVNMEEGSCAMFVS